MAFSAMVNRAAGYIVKAATDWNVIVANFAAIWVGTTNGDMDYYTGSSAKSRLAIGAAGRSLTSIGGVPAWVAFYPVGAIYISTLSTNPGTLLGFGTWETFAAGRVLVGLNSADEDFDTSEETGGEKTHALTAAENGTHYHSIAQRNTSATQSVDSGALVVANNINATNDTTSSGSGTPHNNVQPYVVVYMWKRVS